VVDPGPARPSGLAGGVAIVFGPSFGAAARAGILTGSSHPSTASRPWSGHSGPEAGSGPILSGVGARLDPVLRWALRSQVTRRGQGRPQDEREAKPGDGAEPVEAAGEAGRHRGDASQDPLRLRRGSGHDISARFAADNAMIRPSRRQGDVGWAGGDVGTNENCGQGDVGGGRGDVASTGGDVGTNVVRPGVTLVRCRT